MAKTKTCQKCGESKDSSGFYKHKSTKDGLETTCKTCIKSAAKRFYADNADRVKARISASYDPVKSRNQKLKKNYGITLDDYDSMLEAQDGKCAICKRSDPGHNSGRFVVDHDHNTGAVRKLLCSPCNLMLGHAGDNIETLKSAIEYLNG